MTTLRPLAADDLPALLALQHRDAGPDHRLSAVELHDQLHDAGRGHGRQVVVATRAGHIVGGAGWVEAAPWCFGSPVIAADDEAATLLIAHVVARAHAVGARHLRISALAAETAKRTALAAAGFAAALDFITVVRAVTAGDGTAWSRPWRRIGWGELDVDALTDVHNDTFAGVPNSVDATAAELREQLDGPRVDRSATAAYVDDAVDRARYLAFVQVERDRADRGPVATLATIGVRAAARGHGDAAAIVDDVLARVASDVREARALIASTNLASLGRFHRLGFVERARRTVYQLDLPAAAAPAGTDVPHGT